MNAIDDNIKTEPVKHPINNLDVVTLRWAEWASAKIDELNDENQKLYERLFRAESQVTELEATVDNLRVQLEECECQR